jgi:hypothetical protein
VLKLKSHAANLKDATTASSGVIEWAATCPNVATSIHQLHSSLVSSSILELIFTGFLPYYDMLQKLEHPMPHQALYFHIHHSKADLISSSTSEDVYAERYMEYSHNAACTQWAPCQY